MRLQPGDLVVVRMIGGKYTGDLFYAYDPDDENAMNGVAATLSTYVGVGIVVAAARPYRDGMMKVLVDGALKEAYMGTHGVRERK